MFALVLLLLPPPDAGDRYIYLPESNEVNWEAALGFAIGSSTMRVDMRSYTPQRIPGTRYWRINYSTGLLLSNATWMQIVATYPYSQHADPLCIDGPWLIDQLLDASRSDAYYLMLFGVLPKTETEFWQRTSVDRPLTTRLGLTMGQIETKSGVSNAGIRLLEFLPRYSGYAAVTRDVAEVTDANSPFSQVGNVDSKHDASELIVGVTKIWDGGRGTLQVYALADGNGKIITEAPTSIVTDHSQFAGETSIRVSGSCIGCHSGNGLIPPTTNGLRSWLSAGVELYSKDHPRKEFIERFHLSDTGTFIRRANEDYAFGVMAATGMSTEANAANIASAVTYYRGDVSLDWAAVELGTDATSLKNAIAYHSENAIIVSPHVNALAHGFSMPRAVFEANYIGLTEILKRWSKQHSSDFSSHLQLGSALPVTLSNRSSLPLLQPSIIELANPSALKPSQNSSQPRSSGNSRRRRFTRIKR